MEGNFQKSVIPMKVAVIGLGFVGLPLALLLQQKGFCVTGLDLDYKKVQKLAQGRSTLSEINDEKIVSALTSGRFTVTSISNFIKDQDVIIVCVPTPLNNNKEPDLSYLKKVGESIAPKIKEKQLVVLESSVYPGVTREFFKPLLEQSGLCAGKDFYLAYSPERIDPGNKQIKVNSIPKIVSGISTKCSEEICKVYGHVYEKVVEVSTPETAELTKLLENSYRFINISFINEFADLCEQLNISVWEVIKAASTKPYGYQPFYPGPGIGGHCIPIDPLYLKYKANQIKAPYQFIQLSDEINQSLPAVITNKLASLLPNDLLINEANILIYGVTYKKDVEDARESPAVKIIQSLVAQGAKIQYHDPYLKKISINENFMLKSVSLTKETLEKVDCVLILTDHSNIPVEMILDYAPIVYDTRNVTRGRKGKAKVYRLGEGFSS
ncbi:nucleotide sugar dehydrogenase [Alteribacillus sp. JSM 102045]|uniref:nucleotide sugar dehydrogenase n=1 Tax=Alteribacillus sp. JSM 102045 TaxID=1562101 RepID=UPI0035C212FF